MNIAKVLAVGLLLATATFSKATAQGTISYRTNVLVNVTFNLTSYEQNYQFGSTNGFSGPYLPTAKISKIATDGVIRAIAHQARITNDLSNAKLYYRLSWMNPTNISQDMILRIGNMDTNVNNFVLVSFPDSVSQVRATLNGTTNATDYANCNVSLGTSLGSFTLHGIATLKSASLMMNVHMIDPRPFFPTSFSASVAGSGSIGFHQAEWKGTVMAAGQKVETELVSP